MADEKAPNKKFPWYNQVKYCKDDKDASAFLRELHRRNAWFQSIEPERKGKTVGFIIIYKEKDHPSPE